MAITKVTLEFKGVTEKFELGHAERILKSPNNKGGLFKLKDDKFSFNGSRITRRKSDKGEGAKPEVSE